MSIHPTQVRYLQAEDTLRVTFSDDQQVDFPTIFLRGFCPCAKCQGHSAGEPKWVQATNQAQITIEDVTPVGNYAFCIVWADGHDTGIYAFESLLRMAQQVKAGLPAQQRALMHAPPQDA